MITIRNKQINIGVVKILKDLRLELFEKLEVHIFKDIKVSVDNVQVTCPFHKNGNETRPSLGINIDNGKFNCFTCGEKGSFVHLISRILLENGYKENGEEWLLNKYVDNIYLTREPLPITERRKYIPPKYVSEEELDLYRYYHPYMWKRGLTPEIVEEYDIGYDSYTNCLTFPVNDINGKCLFVARRSVVGKFFHYPTDVEKPVYGLDKCLKSKVIFVCESILNALTLVKWGFKAVALLGTGSSHQYDIFNKSGIRKFILCLDGDSAGDKGVEKFKKNVKCTTHIQVVNSPRDGRDINDLTEKEFLELLNKSSSEYIKTR